MRELKLHEMDDVALREELVGVLQDLQGDELRVAIRIMWRLSEGQKQYGVLDLDTDLRDWREEKAQELVDALMYTEFENERLARCEKSK